MSTTTQAKQLIFVKEKDGHWEVTFKFQTEIYHAIRVLKKAYWLAESRKWIVPKAGNKPDLERILARFNKNTCNSNMVIAPTQGELVEFSKFIVDKTMPKLTIDIPLKKILREYQGEGVAYAIEKGSCIMGDQQGLGKTITAIAAVVAQNSFPCLVICKSSLTTNWEKEIKAWSYKKVIRFNDSVKRSWPVIFNTGFADFGIVSYDSLKKHFVHEMRGKDFVMKADFTMFKSVIIDESHFIKDPTTQRTILTLNMCYQRQNVYCLSGTPVLNKPEELYPQLQAIGKNYLFGSKEEFKKLFGKGSKRQKQALPYLNHLLHKNAYFRRTKEEVAPEIPPKTRQVILCDIDNRAEYDQAENHFEKFLREKMGKTDGQIDRALRAEALTQISYLKFLSAKGKINQLFDWMDTQEEEGEKAVIFVFHKEIQEQVYQWRREGTVRLCGTATPEVLQKRKDNFQENEAVKRIICSIQADAEGHTLTAASNEAIYELPWHFGKAEQIEDRIHRIGTIYPVTINYFLGERTIDRRIYDLIMEKKDMHDLITGTDDDIETKMVDKLITSIFYETNK